MSITLYSYALSDISLAEAIRTQPLDNALALLYAPSECTLALVQAGQLCTATATVDPSYYFEGRIFMPNIELRWLNAAAGLGRAVWLSETPLDLGEPLPKLEALDTLAQQYLLWGTGLDESPAAGWGQLATPRLGSLDIPINGITQDATVILHSREYLGSVDDYGNVSVIEERLTHLEVQ